MISTGIKTLYKLGFVTSMRERGVAALRSREKATTFVQFTSVVDLGAWRESSVLMYSLYSMTFPLHF